MISSHRAIPNFILHPRKLTWQWKKQPFEDASPIKKRDFSSVMVVFGGVKFEIPCSHLSSFSSPFAFGDFGVLNCNPSILGGRSFWDSSHSEVIIKHVIFQTFASKSSHLIGVFKKISKAQNLFFPPCFFVQTSSKPLYPNWGLKVWINGRYIILNQIHKSWSLLVEYGIS